MKVTLAHSKFAVLIKMRNYDKTKTQKLNRLLNHKFFIPSLHFNKKISDFFIFGNQRTMLRTFHQN